MSQLRVYWPDFDETASVTTELSAAYCSGGTSVSTGTFASQPAGLAFRPAGDFVAPPERLRLRVTVVDAADTTDGLGQPAVRCAIRQPGRLVPSGLKLWSDGEDDRSTELPGGRPARQNSSEDSQRAQLPADSDRSGSLATGITLRVVRADDMADDSLQSDGFLIGSDRDGRGWDEDLCADEDPAVGSAEDAITIRFPGVRSEIDGARPTREPRPEQYRGSRGGARQQMSSGPANRTRGRYLGGGGEGQGDSRHDESGQRDPSVLLRPAQKVGPVTRMAVQPSRVSQRRIVDRAEQLFANRECPRCSYALVEPVELNDGIRGRNGREIPGTATLVGFCCQACELEWSISLAVI